MTRTVFAACIVAALTLIAPPASAKDEKAFLKDAIQGNFAEVALGQLAIERAQSEEVKAFGRMLIDDHTANNQKAQASAQQLGV